MLNDKCISAQAPWTEDAPGTCPPEGVYGPVEQGHPSERQASLGEDLEEDETVEVEVTEKQDIWTNSSNTITLLHYLSKYTNSYHPPLKNCPQTSK